MISPLLTGRPAAVWFSLVIRRPRCRQYNPAAGFSGRNLSERADVVQSTSRRNLFHFTTDLTDLRLSLITSTSDSYRDGIKDNWLFLNQFLQSRKRRVNGRNVPTVDLGCKAESGIIQALGQKVGSRGTTMCRYIMLSIRQMHR